MDENEYKLELEKISLDRVRFRFELLKWIVITIGVVVSFWVIDYGNLKLEQYRAQSHNERELLISYMDAMDTSKPDVWRRKIKFLVEYSNNKKIISFAKQQLEYINKYAELDTLYREAIKTASNLAVKEGMPLSERKREFLRFEQLYWAELPFAGESNKVSKAMIQYRKRLLVADAEPDDKKHWSDLNLAMLELSKAIRSSMPNKLLQPTTKTTSQ